MVENNLKEYIKGLGASLVGFADLGNVEAFARKNMDHGIAMGIAIRPEIIKGIKEGPTEEYYEEYKRINKALDHIVTLCVKHIQALGYDAIGQTSTYVSSDSNMVTLLPHKTVATRAGLGWIGKNALLVTPEYGSAIRISSVLTDMPLTIDIPIDESKCGNCTECADACPASAIKGTVWNVNSTREELMDPFECRRKARELAKSRMGIEKSLCGKCIEVCPFTKRYLKRMRGVV